MSKTVKMWLSLLLMVLAAYTLYTMINISEKIRGGDASGGADAVAEQSDAEKSFENADPIDLEKFEMTSQQAQAFPFEELEGQVWIASLFFSSCPHECKSLNTAIASLTRDPEFKDVKFVSISVDPEVDSPQTLAEYARLFDADPAKWLFLTGDLPQVGRFGRAINVPAGYKTHTRRLALIDRDGKIRGQYRYNDAAEIAQLRADLPEILAEKASDVEAEDVESKTGKQPKANSDASVPKGEDHSP